MQLKGNWQTRDWRSNVLVEKRASKVSEKIWIFFYGTFMSSEILQDYGVDCEETLPAKVKGYELVVRPRVNLREKTASEVYGGLARITHTDILRLYTELKSVFGIKYSAHSVTVELEDGSQRNAVCYISVDMRDSRPNPDYVHDLVMCAVKLKAPEEYVRHIRSFAQNL